VCGLWAAFVNFTYILQRYFIVCFVQVEGGLSSWEGGFDLGGLTSGGLMSYN